MKPTILITGGMGYIGSHTGVALLKAGYPVVIVDNYCNAKPDTGKYIRDITGRDFAFYQVDIRDTKELLKVFKNEDIGGVIHFAGLKAVGESCQKPLLYYDNNVNGAISLLSAMQQASCNTIIFSSSATVYGLNNTPPYVESSLTAATNPYGSTKVMIERIIEDMALVNPDFSAALLRYFNPIGAHESGLIGEDPNGIPNNLLPYVAQVAAGMLDELHIYGDDYDTPDGTGVRDYIHVCDLAMGHILALDYALRHKGVQAVNLGTGRGTSVLQIVRAFEKVSDRRIPYRVTGRRPGDVAVCYADTHKARELYGFTATKNIEDMCRDSWRFTKKHYGIQL